MLLDLLGQACQSESDELEGIADGILRCSYVYLVRWLAGELPPIQLDAWQHATLPPIRVDSSRVYGFTDDAFPLGPFNSGAVKSKFDEHLGDVVPLPPENGDQGTINRLILFHVVPAELFLPNPEPHAGGSVNPWAMPEDTEPDPQPPSEQRATMPAAPRGRRAVQPTSVRPTGSPPARPTAVGAAGRRSAEPTTQLIRPVEAVELINAVATVWGPTLEDDRDVVGAAQEVTLVTYSGPMPATLQVFGQPLSKINSGGCGGYPRAFTLPPAAGDRGTQRLLVIR
jgi:hypothetical protein